MYSTTTNTVNSWQVSTVLRGEYTVQPVSATVTATVAAVGVLCVYILVQNDFGVVNKTK